MNENEMIVPELKTPEDVAKYTVQILDSQLFLVEASLH